MSEGKRKLSKDLDILEAITAGLDAYLINDTLFRQMKAGMPKLTLGGFYLRAHRLQALSDRLLDQSARDRLTQAISLAEQTITKRKTQFLEMLHQEAEARQRQWQAYLVDVAKDQEARELSTYRTAVEPRIIFAGLQEQATAHGSPFSADLRQKIEQDDETLKARWQPRKFVWAEDWQPAYPEESFWWLYGKPQA